MTWWKPAIVILEYFVVTPKGVTLRRTRRPLRWQTRWHTWASLRAHRLIWQSYVTRRLLGRR